ncbi:MAG TPA: PilZ domain-containing protein [Phycisphaerales bacterium]|nr:PilZ domain-containing protein [Phycisphaerales bacterium]
MGSQGGHFDGATHRRERTRWPFHGLALVVPDTGAEDAPMDPLLARCSNISGSGVGVTVDKSVPALSQVTVSLPTRAGVLVELRGMVVRSREEDGKFELGIMFETAVDAGMFVGRDPLSNQFEFESVAPAAVVGDVVLSGASEGDADLVRLALRGTHVSLYAGEFPAREQRGSPRRAAMVFDNAGPAEAGGRVLRILQSGDADSVVLVARDREPATRRLVEKLPFAAVLVRPLDRTLVLRGLAQALRRPAVRDERAAA